MNRAKSMTFNWMMWQNNNKLHRCFIAQYVSLLLCIPANALSLALFQNLASSLPFFPLLQIIVKICSTMVSHRDLLWYALIKSETAFSNAQCMQQDCIYLGGFNN